MGLAVRSTSRPIVRCLCVIFLKIVRHKHSATDRGSYASLHYIYSVFVYEVPVLGWDCS